MSQLLMALVKSLGWDAEVHQEGLLAIAWAIILRLIKGETSTQLGRNLRRNQMCQTKLGIKASNKMIPF